jgi:hypothetical protein
MDWKACRCEAVVKEIKDSLPGKEVNIQVTIPEGLPEEDDYMTYTLISESSGTEADPIFVRTFLLPIEKRII